MKRTIVYIGLLLFTLNAYSASPFPSDFYPDGQRPRLWITDERITSLSEARSLETDEWLIFDDYIHQGLTEIPWNGAQRLIAGMALMHSLTGEQQYADRALEVMDQIPNQPENENDAGHGNYGYMALVYDWLYDNPSMTITRKQAYIEKMIHWSDFVWSNPSYNAEGIWSSSRDSDHVILTGVAHLMMGCALYGETERAIDMLDRGWWMWSRGSGLEIGDDGYEEGNIAQPVRQWVKNAIGGHFFTGWSYFWGTDSSGLTQYWMTLETACSYNIAANEPGLEEFWPNVIRTTIDLTDPPRERIHHTGDWEDTNRIEPQAWFYSLLARASYLSYTSGNLTWASYGRGYMQQFASQHDDEFVEFFFSLPTIQTRDPYQDNLPAIRFCNGSDLLFFRDDWEKETTWGMFSGQGAEPVDHQNSDTGNFMLWRENDFLTKSCRTYGSPDNSILFNVLSIQNGLPNGSTRMGSHEGKASIGRYLIRNHEPAFAYAMLQSDDQWDENHLLYNPAIRVDSYRRHFFWSGEYVIIFDRLRTIDPGWCTYRLRALTEPTINENTILQFSENGQHTLIHQTLHPENCTFKLVDETQAWETVYPDWEVPLDERRWQTEIQPADSKSVNLLNVMQMGPSTMTSLDTLQRIQTKTLLGARLGNWVVVFSNEENLLNRVSYQVNDSLEVKNHLVSDLETGSYQVIVNEQPVETVFVTDHSNVAFFTTNAINGSATIRLEKLTGIRNWDQHQ